MRKRRFVLWVLTGVILLGCTDPEPVDISTTKAGVAPQAPTEEGVELTPEVASKLVGLSLACVKREFPNKPSFVLERVENLARPRAHTPAFYGCFDWHSAVHGHWAMVKVLKAFPDLPEAQSLRRVLNGNLTQGKLTPELQYLSAPRNKTFERPYGWGWMLRLRGELETFNDHDAKRWKAALDPIAQLLSKQMVAYLKVLSVPIRAGTHTNTAFAMANAWDYAAVTGETGLLEELRTQALRLYKEDVNCPVSYEPSGEDFLSGCLAEADLMRRVLPQAEFGTWLDGFLPAPGDPAFETLSTPMVVKDPKDPRIGHPIGLHFHRAWAFGGIARGLPESDPRKPWFLALEKRYQKRGYDEMFNSGYGGHHWLASFALLALRD